MWNGVVTLISFLAMEQYSFYGESGLANSLIIPSLIESFDHLVYFVRVAFPGWCGWDMARELQWANNTPILSNSINSPE